MNYHALDERELLDENGRLDIYAFMRSKEIRTYMRKYKTFSVRQKECILMRSFQPMRIKIKAFRMLAQEIEEKRQQEIVLRMADMMEHILSANLTAKIRYESFRFDGEKQVYWFWCDKDLLLQLGYSTEVVEHFKECYYCVEHFSLPFLCGSHVKFQTPWMKHPIRGSLSSTMDGNGCWYHFLERKEGKRQELYQLSYIDIGEKGFFSLFDWLELASEEINEEQRDQFSTPIIPIGEVQVNGSGGCTHIEGYVEQLVDLQPANQIQEHTKVQFFLRDKTGKLKCQLDMYTGDIAWLEDIQRRKGKIRMAAHIVEKEGKLFSEYSLDTMVIDRGNEGNM